VVAHLIRAIQGSVEGDPRPLRSFTAHLCGPVLPGTIDLEVEILRQGTGLTTVAAKLLQEGAVCAHAVADLGRAMAEDIGWNTLSPPEMPSWRQMEPLPMGTSFAPTFTQHFLYRPISGMPFSGKEAQTSGWIRARNPGPRHDAAWLGTLIDAWWLAGWVRLPAPRQAATIAFTLHGLGDTTDLDPEIPLFFRSQSDLLQGGYAVEQRELWTEDGRLVAINHQTHAIIK
jgi:acyl-CoA thioesterase